MAQDKIQMPSSSGGLVRYFDDYKSKVTFSPTAIIIVIAIVIIIELLLRAKVF